jgi:hypothetical protein
MREGDRKDSMRKGKIMGGKHKTLYFHCMYESHVNTTSTFSLYVRENATHHITKINWLTLFKEIITVPSDNHTKPIHTFYEQNARLLNVKVGGTWINTCFCTTAAAAEVVLNFFCYFNCMALVVIIML